MNTKELVVNTPNTAPVFTRKKVSTFQKRFSLLCDSSGKFDTALAEDLRVSKQTVSAWKSGRRSPKEPMIRAIAHYFHVKVEWLMGYDVEKSIGGKRLYAQDSKPKRGDIYRRIAVQNTPIDPSQLVFVDATTKAPGEIELAYPEKSAKLLKVVGKLAKEDPESAVDLLKLLVDRNLI